MALLGYAGGGRLGNFGDVGVDQVTFAPAVFLWFAGIGALTVAMSGGIACRPKAPKPAPEPAPEPEPEPDAAGEDLLDEDAPVDDGAPVGEDEAAVHFDEDDWAADAAGAPANALDDPEDHFVADDDGTPDATRDETRGAAD